MELEINSRPSGLESTCRAGPWELEYISSAGIRHFKARGAGRARAVGGNPQPPVTRYSTWRRSDEGVPTAEEADAYPSWQKVLGG
jgi:hypothetical protein